MSRHPLPQTVSLKNNLYIMNGLKIIYAHFRAPLDVISVYRPLAALVDLVVSLSQSPLHNGQPLSRLQGHGRIPSHPRFLFLYHYSVHPAKEAALNIITLNEL